MSEGGGREAEEEEEEEGGYRTKNKNPTRQCGEQVPFKKPWRSHTTAILNCRTQKSATYYCRTHRFDAPVPMHKVSQHMQNTIAQRQQRREKVTWNLQFHCARKSNRNRRQSDDARNRRARKPTFLRNGTPVYPKKQCFAQILTFNSHP